MEKLWIIDRFEGETAVCEGPDGHMYQLPRAELPEGAREGDCLRRGDSGYFVDAEETRRRRDRNRELFRRLLEDSE